MTIARAIRTLLALAAALVVIWSFVEVGVRIYISNLSHDNRTVLTVMNWGDRAEDKIVADLCAKYEHDHPDIRIARIPTGDPGSMKSKLKTMIAAGTPPDVFYLPPEMLPEMATLGLLKPVDEFVNQEKAAGKGAWFDDYYPIIIKAWRYDTAAQRVGSGPLFGLPKDFTTAAFYVNVDLFDKAGVKVPYDGWTWDEFEADCKKISALGTTPEFKNHKVYGGFFEIWPDTLRNILWTFGGDFFGKDFRDVALDSPASLEALDMICRTRLKDGTVYNPTGVAKDGGQEFINGNIGCIGPVGVWKTARFKEDCAFHWDVVPVPYKEKQFQASQIYYTAWSMSAKSQQPAKAFALMKFLCGPDGGAMQSRLGLAIPPLKSVAESKDFLDPEGMPKHHAQVFLDAISYARLQNNPPEAEWGNIIGDRITKAIQLGQATPAESAKEIRAAWLTELDSPLRQKQWGPMKWNAIIACTAGVLATIIAILWYRARREKLGPLDRATERAGWMFISPWLIGFLALTLGPMIVSLLLSFSKWTGMTPMGTALSVGGANYSQLLVADPTFFKSLRVTIYFVILAVPIGQLAALGVAILMNSKVPGITIFRTIYFVPSVVSGVALAVLWLQIFNNDYGLLNRVLSVLFHPIGITPPDWFGRDAAHWAIPAFVIMGLWGVGGGMIIYLAGLKGIPVSLYEAATIDGAGPFRKFWNVTLPMLSPLLFYNLVMGIIGSFQVFTQAYVMTGAGPDNSTLFYVLNLYRQAFEFHNMGYASAMAWVLFVIVLGLTILVFRGSKNLVYYEGLKS